MLLHIPDRIISLETSTYSCHSPQKDISNSQHTDQPTDLRNTLAGASFKWVTGNWTSVSIWCNWVSLIQNPTGLNHPLYIPRENLSETSPADSWQSLSVGLLSVGSSCLQLEMVILSRAPGLLHKEQFAGHEFPLHPLHTFDTASSTQRSFLPQV